MKHLVLVSLLLTLALLPACHRSSSGGSGSPDTNSDTDTDSDTDVDSDSDTDSDSDSDSDTDTWPNGDTAPEGFGDVVEACWVTTFGESGSVHVRDVVTMEDGTSVVAGVFEDSIILGPGETNETHLVQIGDEKESFVARFDADGALLWARHLTPYIIDLAAAQPDAIVVVGDFSALATFSVGEPDEETLTPYGFEDVFLARYSLDGLLQWVRQDGGSDDTTVCARSLAVLQNGSYALTGMFIGTTTFGLEEEHEVTLEPSGFAAMFVARYYQDGTLAWARADCEEWGCLAGRDIAVHHDDSIFAVAGKFELVATFGEGQVNETTLTSMGMGYEDWWTWPWAVFVAVYDMNGQLQWVKHAEKNTDYLENLVPTAVALTDGSFSTVGAFAGDIGFEYGEPGETILHASYELDDTSPVFSSSMFVARFTGDGEFLWAQATGSGVSSGAEGLGAAQMPEDLLVTTGRFSGAVNFGLGEPADTWLVSEGYTEPFAAVYAADGALQWVVRVGTGWGGVWGGGSMASVASLGDGTFLLAGDFSGDAEFLVGEDEYETVTAGGERDGFLVHVCP